MFLHSANDPEAIEITRLNPTGAYLAWPSALQLQRRASKASRVVREFNHSTCLPPLVADALVRCMNPLFAQDAKQAGHSSARVIEIGYWQHDETRYQPDVEREDWALWVRQARSYKSPQGSVPVSMLTGDTLQVYAPWYPDPEEWAHVLERVRPSNVHYCGELPRANKAAVFSDCRALPYTAQPDYKEALGLIFLEAWASGTPVVALDHHIGSSQSIMFAGLPLGIRAVSVATGAYSICEPSEGAESFKADRPTQVEMFLHK